MNRRDDAVGKLAKMESGMNAARCRVIRIEPKIGPKTTGGRGRCELVITGSIPFIVTAVALAERRRLGGE